MWYRDWNDMYICQDMTPEPDTYTRDYQEENEEEYEEYD